MEDARPLVAEQWNRRADLARPSQAGDERVARVLQQGIDLIVGGLTGAEWKRACLDFVANARAALAAMDTPKGGGE